MKRLYFTVLLFFGLNHSLWANPPQSPDPDSLITFGMMFKLFAVLALLIVVMFLMVKFLKMLTTGKMAGGHFELLGGVSLGLKRSLQLVKFENKIYVIGVTDHSVSLIDKIEPEDENFDIEHYTNRTEDSVFAKLLKSTGLGKSTQ